MNRQQALLALSAVADLCLKVSGAAVAFRSAPADGCRYTAPGPAWGFGSDGQVRRLIYLSRRGQ